MRLSMANPSETDRADLRSCEKVRQTRKEDPQAHLRVSFMKRNTKAKMEAEDRQCKITKYIGGSNSISKPRITLDDVDNVSINEKENKSSELQSKLSEKDDEIKKIRINNETLKSKVIESREELKKRQKIIADSMLELAEIKRNQRRKINKEIGYYTDNFRRFVQGSGIVSLREKLKNIEKALAKIEDEKILTPLNSNQYVCLLSVFEFKTREMNEIKKELQNRQKEAFEYRERLRLVDKEEKSLYCIQGWPIIYEKYQTLELLGSGGFGQVYKCYNLEKNKLVAIKRMKFDTNLNVNHFEQFCKHVRREIDTQMKLSHPNIAKLESVLEIDEDKRCIVFELEYCQGPELSAYMKKHRIIEEKQAKIYIKQILCALNYLFNLKDKVIHYDLKPSNIIFHEGVIKILDFGLCKIIDSNNDETKIELTSQGVGTYWYLPPQTFESYDPKISSKVDVWSVGVIFFEMLYGRRPFGHGLSQTQINDKGVILKATKVEFPPDPSKKHKISEAAKEFICACLKYQPQERLNPTEAFEHSYLNLKK